MLKRTLASLRQFGTFISVTYSLPNPTSSSSLSPHSSLLSPNHDYITHFTNYLTSDHLSPLTIKSYKSDVSRYLDWTTKQNLGTEPVKLLTDKNINKYLNHLRQSVSSLPSTIERKSQSLARFRSWYTNVYAPTSTTDSTEAPSPSHSRSVGALHSGSVSSPGSVPSSHSGSASSLVPNLVPPPGGTSVRNFATLAILLLFISSLALFAYRQFARDATLTAAYPATAITPNRQLSFQGRLENAAGAPITTATNFVFKLFTASSGGTELYSTGTCAITPDSDGVFNTQIGSTCGAAIASSVFTENSDVWLEAIVGAETLAPRQQIATVAYALNSETLQGFPLSATISAIRNTIVPMNQYGEIIVGEQSPRLTGVSGTFQISAPALSLTTATGTNGNITLAPDGTGQVNLNGNTTSTNFFNVSNAQLTTGSLITGTVGNANTGFKLIDLLSGSSPTSKFSVTDTGLTTVGADLYLNSGLSTFGTAVTDGTLEATKFCTGDGETNCVTDFSSIGGGSSVWSDLLVPTANLSLAHAGYTTAFTFDSLTAADAFALSSSSLTTGTVLDLSSTSTAGGASGLSKVLDITRSGTNANASHTAYGLYSAVTNTGTTSTNVGGYFSASGATNNYAAIFENGNVGIGDTTPDHTLDVAGNIGLDASGYINWGDTDGTTGYGFRDNAGAIEFKNSAGTWAEIGSGSGSSYWTQTLGTLQPLNATVDLLIGGTATASAKFAVNATNGNTTIAGDFTLPNSNTLTGVSNYLRLSQGLSVGGADTYYFNSSGAINAAAVTATSLTDSSLSPGSIVFAGTAGLLSQDNSNFYWDNTNKRLGVGTSGTGMLATLDVRSTLGTLPVASISGATSHASLVVDQSGIGDLFTASKSGDTKFVVTNAGNVGIGVSAPTNKLEIAGATSVLSNTSGDLTIDSASSNISFAGDSLINILNTYLSGELGVGIADAVSKLHVYGAVTGKALVIFDEIGDQDILTASASGTTKFRITNAGNTSLASSSYLNFGLTDGTSGYGIRDNAGTLEYKNLSGSWAGIGTGGGGGAWSDITDPTANLALTMGAYTSTFTYNAATGASNLFNLTDTTSNTGTGYLLNLTTASGSTLKPFHVSAAGTEALTVIANGNVGLGNTTPVGKLDVSGAVAGKALAIFNETGDQDILVASASGVTRFRVATDGYVYAQRFADTASSSYYLDPAATGTSLMVDGNLVSDGAFSITSNATDGNITLDAGSGTVLIGSAGAGKLDAGTIDPPYTINGDKFATYMAGMTGVKEETTGVVQATEFVPGSGYRATLDFAGSLTGSDLWLFSKTSNLQNNLDKMVVLLSATGSGRTWYEINASAGQLYLYSDSPATISYRLTAPRFDANSWANTRGDDSESLGFVINDENTWSVPESLASLFSAPSSDLFSPLASDSAITITAPVVISSPLSPLSSPLPLLIVEGEIDAATISARVAKLQDIQADTITARNIVADTIEANHIIGLDAKIASLSAGLTDSEVESITDRIKARLALLTGNAATATDIPAPIAPEGVSLPNYEGDSLKVATNSATLASASIDFATINNYLAVIGSATITTLDVTANLYTNSIQSKCPQGSELSGSSDPCSSSLALQPLGGIINLASGTLIVDSSGQVAINGDLSVSGTLTAQTLSVVEGLTIGQSATPPAGGSALGHLLSIYNEAGEAVATIDASGSANLAQLTTGMITIASPASPAIASASAGLASLLGTAQSNATAGESTLVSPNTQLTIESPYITPNSLVYLTPTTNTDNKVLFVKSKNTCVPNLTPNDYNLQPPCTPSFTVAIDAPATSDISFNWWVIQLAQPKEGVQ